MNYKDVALLNDSLDSLGQGLLKKRMLEMQDTERQAKTGLESQKLGIDQARFDAEKTHWDNIEKQVGLQNAFKQTAEAGQSLRQSMHDLAEQVRGAGMDNDTANEYFKGAVDGLPAEVKTGMMNQPQFKAAYDGSMDWSTFGASPGPKDIKPQEFNLGNRKGVYNPATGSFQVDQQKWAPEDLIELRDLNGQLRGFDKQTQELAKTGVTAASVANQAPEARALNAQRRTVETRKAALFNKYAQPAATGAGGASTAKPLDEATAKAILEEAGGDKAKARKIAEQRGYGF